MKLIVLGQTNDDRGAQLEVFTKDLLEKLGYEQITVNKITDGVELDPNVFKGHNKYMPVASLPGFHEHRKEQRAKRPAVCPDLGVCCPEMCPEMPFWQELA